MVDSAALLKKELGWTDRQRIIRFWEKVVWDRYGIRKAVRYIGKHRLFKE